MGSKSGIHSEQGAEGRIFLMNIRRAKNAESSIGSDKSWEALQISKSALGHSETQRLLANIVVAIQLHGINKVVFGW